MYNTNELVVQNTRNYIIVHGRYVIVRAEHTVTIIILSILATVSPLWFSRQIGRDPFRIRYLFFIKLMTLSTWFLIREGCFESFTSLRDNCVFPQIKAGISMLAPITPRSAMEQPWSVEMLSPRSIWLKKSDDCARILSKTCLPQQSDKKLIMQQHGVMHESCTERKLIC